MFESVLSQYRNYLQSRQLVKLQQLPPYVNWVEQFLAFATRTRVRDFKLCLIQFLDELSSMDGVKDWEVGQAKNAIHIYYYQFRRQGNSVPECQPLDQIDAADLIQVKDKTIAVLRLKNYAYRTEEAYLKWIIQFYCFIKRNRGAGAVPVSEDVRNFITQLALRGNIASSTQNQAFNALLFMCRQVIGLELEDMDKNVRARRGQKLGLAICFPGGKSVTGSPEREISAASY